MTFAASIQVRPLQDNSGMVLFDSFANQTHLLRYSASAPHTNDFPSPFTEQDFIAHFGSEDGTLGVLISRNLVVPFEE